MRRTSRAVAAIFSAAVAGVVCPLTAHAAEQDWVPGNTGDFGLSSNWQSGVVPGSGDQANVSQGTATISSGESFTVAEIWAGFENPGTVVQTGGTITANGWVVLGRGVVGSTTGFYNFAGGTINQSGGEVQLAGVTSAGAGATVMTISQNTSTPTVLNNSGTFDIGDNAATVNQSGGTVNSTGQLWIGQSGLGIYNLSGGAVNSTNWAVIGRSGGTGVLNMTGGVFSHAANSGGDFEVGSGGNATLNLNGGTLITNYIRDENSSSQTATINLNGGVIQANNSDSGFIGGHMSNNDVFNLNVLQYGAVFNTSSYNIGVTEPLVHGTAGPATDGGLIKYGTGALSLSGTDTYNGPTSVNAGTLNLLGSSASAITVNSGATLNLLGSTSSTVAVNAGGTIGAYNATGAGGSVAGSLTFNGSATLLVNPTGTQFLTVSGAVNGSNASVAVIPTLTTPAVGVREEVLYAQGGIAGTVSGPSANFSPTIRGTLTEAADPNGGTDLFLTSSGAASLVWKGTSPTNPSYWDVQTTPNFYNTGTSQSDVFYSNDNVTFDDTGAVTNVAIQGAGVFPGSVTFNNSAKSYTFTGGAIAGSTGVSINGGGTVTLNQSNSYTGATNINSGTLVVGTGGSLSAGTNVTLGSATNNSSGVLKLGDATGPVSVSVAGFNVVGTGAGNQLIGGNATTSTLTVSSSVYVGTPASSTATLTIGAGANLYGNTGGDPSFGIGPQGGTNGTVTVLTGGTLTANSSDIWVGNGSGGVGTLNIDGGTVLTNGWISPGRAGGTGTINMTGGTLTKTGSGNLDIAGDGAGSHGYFYQTGGTVTTSTFVVLGENNTSEVGYWNLSGGSTSATIPELIVGSGGTGTVNIFSGGTMTVTSNNGTIVGQNSGAAGTLNITGATENTDGLTASYAASVTVGAGGLLNIPNGAPNTAIASGGGTNATFNVLTGGTFNGGNGQVFIGNSSGTAVLNVSGTVNVDNYLAAGRIGATGTVNLSAGGTINVQESDINYDSQGNASINLGNGETIFGSDGTAGQGYFNQTGGNFNSPATALVLGETAGNSSTASASGVWNFNAGTATLTSSTNGFTAPYNFYNSLTVGQGGNGVVNVSGTAQLTAGNVVLASGTSSGTNLISNGALNVSGGTVTVRSIDVGLGGNGVVNVTGGQLSSTSLTLATTYSAYGSATGTLSLSGGTLTTTAITAGSSFLTPAVNLNGGILQAGGNTTSFISLPSGTAVQIGSTGATIDTQAYSVGIPSTLAGSGGLTKIGTGNLRLSTSNSYGGNTTVSAGTLTVAASNALSTGSVSLANNTTLALAAAPSSIAFSNYSLNAQTPVFSPVVSASQTAVTLTTTTGSDAVSIFDNNQTTINDATGFAASFTYNHATTGPEQTGADGVVFVLQSPNNGQNQYNAGGAGGSIAYNGAPGFGYSVAAAVDLFLDRLDLGSGNQSNGAFTTTQPEDSSPQISTATTGNVSVVYTPGVAGAAGTLTETFTGLFNGSSTTTSVSTGIDPVLALGGSAGGSAPAYLGFTSSTGGAADVQTISDFKFNNDGTTIPSNNTAAVSISNPVFLASTAVSPASANLQLAPTAGFSSGTVGAITVGPAGTLNLTIGYNAATGVTHGVLSTPSLSIGSAATLNVNNNALDITAQPGGSSATPLQAVTALVTSGYNNGHWNGSGISSAAAAADTSHLTAVGVILNSVDGTTSGAALYGSGTAKGLFDGISPASNTDILVKYTYYGDTNLDGQVDGTDYARVDAAFESEQTSHSSISGWYNGDFNYDGVVDGSDYTLMDNAFNSQGLNIDAAGNPQAQITDQIAGASPSAAVPEPTTLGLLAIGAAGLLGRRRRRH